MPLRDHFRPPLDDFTSWDGVHGQWPAVIVHQLRNRLPQGYIAAPRVHLGAEVEIDVATFESDGSASFGPGAVASDDETGRAVWAPAQPTLTIETDLPQSDEYEVRVYDVKRGRRLVAAVEIISPSNKDRPEHRRLFVAKCAALLNEQVSVAIVDLVTIRDFNLYSELLEFIGQADASLGDQPPSTYAVACRWTRQGRRRLLKTWNEPLVLGHRLPTLPLWLTDTLAVPLELEESYEQTCWDLHIP